MINIVLHQANFHTLHWIMTRIYNKRVHCINHVLDTQVTVITRSQVDCEGTILMRQLLCSTHRTCALLLCCIVYNYTACIMCCVTQLHYYSTSRGRYIRQAILLLAMYPRDSWQRVGINKRTRLLATRSRFLGSTLTVPWQYLWGV